MLRTAVFLAMLGLTCAAVARGFLPTKPRELAHKEGCYIEQIGDVIPFGAVITGPGCVRISCGRMIDYATCGVIGTSDSNCYVTKGDHSRQYPDCCPTIESHKEGCYIEEIGDVIPFGAVVTGPGCVRIGCLRMIDYATCGVIGTSDSNCYVTKGDHSRQYPDCCPTIECEQDNYVESKL